MVGEHQRQRADAASNVDYQRALRELSPGVPYQFDDSVVRWCAKAAQLDRTFENGLRWGHVLNAIHAGPESRKA